MEMGYRRPDKSCPPPPPPPSPPGSHAYTRPSMARQAMLTIIMVLQAIKKWLSVHPSASASLPSSAASPCPKARGASPEEEEAGGSPGTPPQQPKLIIEKQSSEDLLAMQAETSPAAQTDKSQGGSQTSDATVGNDLPSAHVPMRSSNGTGGYTVPSLLRPSEGPPAARRRLLETPAVSAFGQAKETSAAASQFERALVDPPTASGSNGMTNAAAANPTRGELHAMQLGLSSGPAFGHQDGSLAERVVGRRSPAPSAFAQARSLQSEGDSKESSHTEPVPCAENKSPAPDASLQTTVLPNTDDLQRMSLRQDSTAIARQVHFQDSSMQPATPHQQRPVAMGSYDLSKSEPSRQASSQLTTREIPCPDHDSISSHEKRTSTSSHAHGSSSVTNTLGGHVPGSPAREASKAASARPLSLEQSVRPNPARQTSAHELWGTGAGAASAAAQLTQASADQASQARRSGSLVRLPAYKPQVKDHNFCFTGHLWQARVKPLVMVLLHGEGIHQINGHSFRWQA